MNNGLHWEIGMLFDCKKDLQLAVKKYCVTEYYKIVNQTNIFSILDANSGKMDITGGYMKVDVRATKCLKLLGSKDNTHVCIYS